MVSNPSGPGIRPESTIRGALSGSPIVVRASNEIENVRRPAAKYPVGRSLASRKSFVLQGATGSRPGERLLSSGQSQEAVSKIYAPSSRRWRAK